MDEKKTKGNNQWAVYCTKCGKCYGDNWGMHVCPDCGGNVDILKEPPRPLAKREGIHLRL